MLPEWHAYAADPDVFQGDRARALQGGTRNGRLALDHCAGMPPAVKLAFVSGFSGGSEIMRGVIKKWGNSAAVRIPASMLKTLRLGPDSLVDIRLERNQIIIEPIRNQEYVLSQLLGGIKSRNLHPEIDFGSAGD